jgi:hypothetical protein
MHSTTLKKTNGRQTKRRIVAFVFLLCFVTTVMLSGTFALSHADHSHHHEHHNHSHENGRECTGADDKCAKTCAHLCKADTVVKSVSVSAGGVQLDLSILFTAISLLFAASCCNLSPVELRIRANC